MTPSGVRGVLNDVVAIGSADATLAGAFVARCCVGSKVEAAGGVFQVREDEPAPRRVCGRASPDGGGLSPGWWRAKTECPTAYAIAPGADGQ